MKHVTELERIHETFPRLFLDTPHPTPPTTKTEIDAHNCVLLHLQCCLLSFCPGYCELSSRYLEEGPSSSELNFQNGNVFQVA
jgi:hypothetical protein